MIRLRLFHHGDPGAQIDTRVLGDAELSIGRGADADWRIDDAERAISRRHLTITQQGGMLTLRDVSSTGVFVGTPRQRVEHDRPTPIARGEPVHFGAFVLVAEEDDAASEAPPAPRQDGSPFEAPSGVQAGRGAGAPTRRDPFGSALKSDPVALDQPPSPDGVDAWERRTPSAAGSWEARPAHLQADHARLIGTPQRWPEPPPPAAEAGFGFDAPFTRPILAEPPISGRDVLIPSDWDVAAEPTSVPTQATPASAAPSPSPTVAPPLPPLPETDAGDELFDRFCAGAHLSADAFSGEDRAALMERLGGVYRQAILGIADLMGERTALKNDYRMARTTIRAEGNNPFKWVPPQRIAVELLRSDGGSGYVTGERALNDALHDIKGHLLCTLAGMRAALGSAFDLLSPAEVEKRIVGRTYLTRGQRETAAWAEYHEKFAELRRDADDSADGPINKAFRQAYEHQARELDGHGSQG